MSRFMLSACLPRISEAETVLLDSYLDSLEFKKWQSGYCDHIRVSPTLSEPLFAMYVPSRSQQIPILDQLSQTDMHDLTNASGFRDFLLDRTILVNGPYSPSSDTNSVRRLTGGSSAFAYRIQLETPLQTGETSVVAKHVQGHASSSSAGGKWALGQDRLVCPRSILLGHQLNRSMAGIRSGSSRGISSSSLCEGQHRADSQNPGIRQGTPRCFLYRLRRDT